MDNCYPADHTAEDHIHTDIICNIDEPQQKYSMRKLKNAYSMQSVGWLVGWLVSWLGFKSPLRQYFSLYRAVSQIEGERGEIE